MIKPIDPHGIPTKTVRKGRYTQQLFDFIDSGELAGEFDAHGLTAKNAYQTLYTAIKTHNLPVMAIRRGDRVFVIRKDRSR